MLWIAFKMLVGNRGKYVGMVLGITFAALLIGQQSGVFCGIMWLTTSQIRDVQDADIWVMDGNVEYIDDIKPMRETDLYRVRGIPGVAWAVRLYKGIARARLEDGNYQQMILMGLDDDTLVGAPRQMVLGSLDDLRRPDAIIMDDAGYWQIWPDQPLETGRVLEMNDTRAVVAGICKASRTFQRFPIVYTRYSEAVQFVPTERKVLSFVLAKPEPDVDAEEVCRRIESQTDLRALSSRDFAWRTVDYYLRRTGIPVNFGTTVLLGFLVGAAIAGQTFYMFTIDNLKEFGTLKALGTSNRKIVMMVLFQAAMVGLVGYSIGIGLAAIFGELSANTSRLAFLMPWQVLVGTGAAVLLIVLVSSVASVRRVLVLEPAVVFQGA
ncbi:MAG: FtsX-like permease family protein [Phycisphaerae bacterium]|nr:FtsX-like permease family protein [Phycisphaerae bacterium]